MRRSMVARAAGTALAFSVSAQVYKWTDLAGKVHYGAGRRHERTGQAKIDPGGGLRGTMYALMSTWFSSFSRCLIEVLGPRILWLVLYCLLPSATTLAGALEDYVSGPDPFYNWKRTEKKKGSCGMISQLELVSQHWRNQFWSHHLLVVQPNEIRNPGIGFFLVTGDGDGEKDIDMLKTLAERAGAVAAVITNVPNQPLYDGRREDALIAYTFDQYLRTGDETWPLLFPMVKSVVRGMDTVQGFVQEQRGQRIERFVVAGASKRGWTTWLTAAVDPRVKAIAPDGVEARRQNRWHGNRHCAYY